MKAMNFLKVAIILAFFGESINVYGQGMLDVSERKRLHVKEINNAKTIFDLNSLPICSRYGCKEITHVSLTTNQWENIISELKSRPASAAKERELLSDVIGQIEIIVGEINNTHGDIGGTFNIYLSPSQGKSE